MVALPVIDNRPAANATLFGSPVCTGTKLVPRKGSTPSWNDELSDVLAAHQLIEIKSEEHPPTHEQLSFTLHG